MKAKDRRRPVVQATTEKIQANSEACSGCQMCQLICSFAWARSFSPAQSYILIEELEDEIPYRISFTDDCRDCGLCVKYCFYGALKLREGAKK